MSSCISNDNMIYERVVSDIEGKFYIEHHRITDSYILFFELPITKISKVEWIDFIVKDIPREHVSSVEKMLVDDMWGCRARAFGYVVLTSTPRLNGELKVISSESTPMTFKFGGYNRELYSFIGSFSIRLPSPYRSGIFSVEMPIPTRKIMSYYNSLSSIAFRERYIPPTDSKEAVLMPINYFGGADLLGSPPIEYLDIHGLNNRSLAAKYRSIISDKVGNGNYIFPIVQLGKDGLEGGFIIVDNGRFEVVDYPILDLDESTLVLGRCSNPSFRRPCITFKRFRSVVYDNGLTFYINYGFIEYRPPSSHKIVELRRGGKLIWSSSSSKGLKELCLW